jgi:hypothetical protein
VRSLSSEDKSQAPEEAWDKNVHSQLRALNVVGGLS